jgi:hypothetical protein
MIILTICKAIQIFYMLMAVRMAIWFIGMIIDFAKLKPDSRVVEFINKYMKNNDDRPIQASDKYYYISKLIPRAVFGIICWPVDFFAIPVDFIQALFIKNKLALVKLGAYYGSTSYSGKK